CLILHLGMSGSLRIITGNQPPQKHDHLDIEFESGLRLRFRDPRRFGCVLWTAQDPMQHKLLVRLGLEPLGDAFDGAYLHRKSRGRTQAIKTFIMDSHIVVGVGNIYASEALFRSGVRPQRRAGLVSRQEYDRLAQSMQAVLREAIAAGGTTLRDYVSGEGKPGYFAFELNVYDQVGEPCPQCGHPIKRSCIGQRSAYFCAKCQR
ncbi:MAG: mutM, partial [Gammaproteobacteria bacterium]|nr:mutM [Gammaproteobacteria bacterium]